MTKEVRITVRGFENMDGSWEEPVSSSARGKYIFRSGHHFVSYEEEAPENGGTIRNVMKFGPGYLGIQRKGALSLQLEMLRRRRSLAVYDTPAGRLELELEASSLTLVEREDLLELEAVYALYSRGEAGEPLQRRKVLLRVEACGDEESGRPAETEQRTCGQRENTGAAAEGRADSCSQEETGRWEDHA